MRREFRHFDALNHVLQDLYESGPRSGPRSESNTLSRMAQFSFVDRPVPAELGAIAHGPLLLSEVGGYRIGLRYIVAYRLVMDVAIAVAARGPESADLAAQFTVREIPGEPLTATKRRRRDGFVARVASPELGMSARGSNRNPFAVEGHYIREFPFEIDGPARRNLAGTRICLTRNGLEREQCALTIPSAHVLDEALINL